MNTSITEFTLHMSRTLFTQIDGKAGEIVDFIMHTPEVSNFPTASYAVRLACEEIVVNIIRYAYSDISQGYIKIDISLDGRELHIEIRDGGTPFNPLGRETPDTALPPEERDIGGLGIYLVRRMMDRVCYMRHNGENCLLLVKYVSHEKA